MIGVEFCVEPAEVDRSLSSYIELLRDDMSCSLVVNVNFIGTLTTLQTEHRFLFVLPSPS